MKNKIFKVRMICNVHGDDGSGSATKCVNCKIGWVSIKNGKWVCTNCSNPL